MADVFGDYRFAVRSYECGPDGCATLASICNYLQEAASLNAESLKFSKSDFAAAGDNTSWVLTRMRVQMDRYPKWEAPLSVTTWPRSGRKIVAYRDFILRGADGAEIGRATTEWMLIDLASRRAVAIPEGVFAAANDVRPPVLGEAPFSRLKWTCQTVCEPLRFPARRADIDLNGHVNNVHYVEWALESMPDGKGVCADFEIQFRSETLAGDTVLSEAVEVAPSVFAHRLSSPDGTDHALARTVWR